MGAVIWHRANAGYFTRLAADPTDERTGWAIMRDRSARLPWGLHRVDYNGGAHEVSRHLTLLAAKRAARRAER